jgi:ABC-type multidrug transport system ATPase subunit
MSENIIEVRNLSKKFRNHLAVKNISFDLKQGEIKGILGANGAGKTTTIC